MLCLPVRGALGLAQVRDALVLSGEAQPEIGWGGGGGAEERFQSIICKFCDTKHNYYKQSQDPLYPGKRF